MGYRQDFFNNTPSMLGKYQCAKCKKWFTKDEIDVDHRLSKRKGGTDDLWNLQAMCKSCNRGKRERSSNKEVAETVISAGITGLATNGLSGAANNLSKIGKSVAKQKLKDALGIKYKR